MYRSTSPYRAPSPYGPPPDAGYASAYSPGPQAAPGSPYAGAAAPTSPQATQIAPGSITYTTSTSPDGKIIYHPFKAVPASYQTPTGVVSGIQWVPAEATQILPPGAQPASTDFAEAWNRGNLSKEDKHALKDWQRAEDKRRRKEEKESAKILREKERLNQARYDDGALRYAREQDGMTRERRKSFNQGVNFPGAPASAAGSIYSPPSPYQGYAAPPAAASHSPGPGYARERKYSTGGGVLSDLDNQFGTMGISDRGAAERARRLSGNFGAERPPSVYGNQSPNVGSVYAPPARPHSRNSAYGGSHSPNPGSAPLPYGPPRPHSRNASVSGAYPAYTNPSPGMRSADPAGGAGGGYAPRPSSPYAGGNYPLPGAPLNDPYARSGSPYAPPAALPHSQDIYPPGHVMEGQPIPRSRATTPIPGAGPGAYPPAGGGYPSAMGGQPMQPPAAPGQQLPGQQLSAPECFSRPINGAHPYTPFETMKIQDMNDFFDSVPRMPAVLQPHDVYAEDWARLVEDLTLAWSGRLPVPAAPDGQTPKRATVTASLVDLWNLSFLNRRGVELVLYKGRERRSGPHAGQIDYHLPIDDHADVSSSDSEDDDDDDDDEDEARYNAAYGRTGYAPDMAEIRQRRMAEKVERKRRRKEKKNRQKAREREKKYTLYLTYIPQHGGPTAHPTAHVQHSSHHGGVPTTPSSGYGAAPAGYGGALPRSTSPYMHAGSLGYGGGY